MTIEQLANEYHAAIHAMENAAIAAEQEAQLTTPVSNLFTGLALQEGMGQLRLIRETPLGRTRPDFAVLLTRGGATMQRGYIELKAPSISVNPTLWVGRNRTQWERMSNEAEILVVCNGVEARLFQNGNPIGEAAALPFDNPGDWDYRPIANLLDRFLALTPSPVVSVTDLSRRLALRTADLRDRLLWLMEQEGPASNEALSGHLSWAAHVDPHATTRDFADSASQVVAYGMVLAALSAVDADANEDGLLTVSEARNALREFSPVMAAAFAPLVDRPALFLAVEGELGALETLISAIDRDRVNLSADPRGEPWLYFYEDFLSVYDPVARRQAGVYFTPLPIVNAMVNIVDNLLTERFGRRLGFADPNVVTLDPAAGTGTFPLSVIDAAVRRATTQRGPAGAVQAASTLSETLFAFEMLPGPYSVAHLRLTQRLHALSELGAGMVMPDARAILTDTLESPYDPPDPSLQFGDAQVLAAEQNRSVRVKLDQRVTVVLGNPPYRRVSRDEAGRGSGGWVIEGNVPNRNDGNSLFDDLLNEVAAENINFANTSSLYNLYVYFWRWAIWKAFEAHGDGPGVVSFITASSWLKGAGFVGLRRLVRELCDEAWIVDLGGDNRGANPEENVFAIETPVSVVVLVRSAESARTEPATVHYRRVHGTEDEKLDAMQIISEAVQPLDGEWAEATTGWTDSFIPSTGSANWNDMPLLTDIFPWQQPGCKFGRTWPIAPTCEILERRWTRFTAAPPEQKPRLFSTGSSGRNVTTKVSGMATLSEVREGDASEPIVRYGYRSFDRQWAFSDKRMAKTDSPSLWQSTSNSQLYLASLLTRGISEGPALTVSADVPDLHFYRGSFGGKDIIPIYRNAAATEANLTEGFALCLSENLDIDPPSVEDIAAYTYALLSASNYQERFNDELQTAGLRVPITKDPELWHRVTNAGRYLIWLHTYAERFRNINEERNYDVPLVDGIGWVVPVRTIPENSEAIEYRAETNILYIGDGQVSGVRADVWNYSVTGLQVVAKWLGYRTASGSGRAASSTNELDRIRPEEWHDEWNDELLDLLRILTITLDRQAELTNLLNAVCDGELLSVEQIPQPWAVQRRVPATVSTGQLGLV